MSELLITVGGGQYRYGPGVVRIGRSSENDIVINDPTVSRRHAQISWESEGWVWQNLGQAPTFLHGQPVARFVIGEQVDVMMASPQGPVVQMAAVAEMGRPAGSAPMPTQLAGTPGVAGAPPTGQLPQAFPPAAAAAAAAPVTGFAGGMPGGQQGQGYPGQQQVQPYPGQQAAGVPGVQPGFGPPGMPGYPGFGPAVPQFDATKLERGSFIETLVPLKSWLHDKSWRQGLRLLVIPYALLPLIFLQVFSTATSLSTPGWAYSLYVAPLWIIAFWYLIRPPRWGRTEIWIAIGVVIWEYIWLHAVTININDHLATGRLTFIKALVVGYNEETSKAIPVLVAAAILLTVRKQKLDPRTWMLMGTIAGLTFGVIEQSIYTPAAIVAVHNAQNASQADAGALDFAFRVFVDGFQHAVWAGVSGFFVGMAINYRKLRIPLLLLGISIPAVLHALNDWTLTIFSTVWVTVFFVQGASLLLFLGYTLSAADIERRVRRNPAFRGQSIMMERFTQP